MVVFTLYVMVALMLTVVFAGFAMESRNPRDRRHAALVALLSFLWPIALVAFFVYGVVWLIATAVGVDTRSW